MKKILLAVFCLLSSVAVFAQSQNLDINWQQSSIDGQSREVTDDSNINKSLAIVGGGSQRGSATNNTLTIDGHNVSITDSNVLEEIDEDSSNPNYYRKGAYVAGGAVLNNQATGNTLNLLNSANLNGRDAYGGAAVIRNPADRFGSGSANNNVANVDGVTTKSESFFPAGSMTSISVGGNVYGGYSEYSHGTANNNKVNITNSSTINGNVYGGMVKDQLDPNDISTEGALDTYADGNTVYVKDSIVNGTVAGAAGASTTNNNTVVVENSTVTTVLGAAENHGLDDGSTSLSYANNNTVTIKGNSTITNAAAVQSESLNANGNSLTIDNSTVTNGSIYAVNMGLGLSNTSESSVLATVGNNNLFLNTLTGGLTELGGSLNLAGTADGNKINITDSSLTLTNSSKKFMNGVLNAPKLETDNLLSLPYNKGLMFGGASMYYTSQTGTGEEAPEVKEMALAGTNSDGNSILLQNGSFTGNVMGGFSAYIVEVDYTVVSDPGEGAPAGAQNEEKVYKNGLVTTTTTTTWEKQEDDSWVQKTETSDPQQADQIDDVYSASNNTVVLDGVTFDGKLYGGYIDGAELKDKNKLIKNNTVVLRGAVNLSDATVLYGSNVVNDYTETNNLVFDKVQSTFKTLDQFQNFNSTWAINADFNTNIDFQFDHVTALLTPDASAMQSNSAVVVKTHSDVDLTGIQQGEDVSDLINSTISLGQERIGVYTFDLTPTAGSASSVNWTLTGKKDRANMEVYGQLPLVGLALASEGGELLTHSVSDAWKSDNDFSTFLNGGYHHTRYETGSGFDLDSALVQVGAWKKFNEEWLGGFFAKYSNGSYETYPIKVTGAANVFGGGLMTSYRYSETGRLEATLEAGYMDMDFESAALISSFESKGAYYGASAGFVESLMQDLDLFANINWLRKGKDDITDNLNQKVTFEAMQSLNLRFGADYTFSNVEWDDLIPSIGVMGIYEFDGDSSVVIDGEKNDDASLKGMSGRGQISVAYQNNDSFLPLRTVFTAYGQLGNRKGFGGEVNISFEF